MSSYERNATAFDELVLETANDITTLSEADTRVKLIDRILHDCLGWPEAAIQREEHVHAGYIDYTLLSSGHGLILEAKRAGETFALPLTIDHDSNLTVKNLLQKERDLQLLYDQVARYAHERGIPYCSLSNGTQWIVFPGVRTDNIHVRKSRVIAFNGLQSIRANFLAFWNLLAYEVVGSGSLDKALSAPSILIEPSFIFNAEGRLNVPYDRNHLSLVLVDLLPKYFGDLHGEPGKTEMLEECFVSDAPARTSLSQLGPDQTEEAPPKILTAGSGILHFYTLPQVSEKLDVLISAFLTGQREAYFQVILGRVGIGKTTFLAHFFGIHRASLGQDNYVLQIDCQHVTENTNLDVLFDEAMWEYLVPHPRFATLSGSETLRRMFKADLAVLASGPLQRLKQRDPEKFEDEIDRYLGQRLQDRAGFLRSLARFLHTESLGRFLLVFDNVDQLDAPLQEKVIRFAYAKMKEYRAFTVLSMWEETYFSSKKSGRTLSTIRTVPLQITRQSATSVLVKRLTYLLKEIRNGHEELPLLDEAVCDRSTFCDFLQLILRSLLVDNRRVRVFLELLALGNIRRSLETFSSFLTAGSLETRKIIDFMKANEAYRVPVHEFIKSVMLGSKRYYSERTSDVLNLFAIGDVEVPSHFTRLRILQWLYERRHEATPFGTGMLAVPALIAYFRSIGTSEKDLRSSIRNLVDGALIENELRARKVLDDAQTLRITAAGRYYLITLNKLFPYIDLVMQDTPFFDRGIFDDVAPLCESTDMSDRMLRCDLFLDYLADQEDEELVALDKLGTGITWRKKFIPRIRRSLVDTRRQLEDKGVIPRQM